MNIRGFPFILGPVLCTLIVSAGLEPLPGQTLVNLSAQGKDVDFTNQPYTRPLKTGISLPATCTTGDMYLNIAGAVGKNIYACTATNTWTLQSSTPGIGGPSSSTNGYIPTWNGTTGTALNSGIAAPAGNLVGTGQVNTFGPYLQDFSGGSLKAPIATGYAPTTSGLFGYNSTLNLFTGGANGVTYNFPWISGSITNGDCVEWVTGGGIADAGSPCGSGSSSGITVQNGGTSIGTATTINFGSNLSASLTGGIVTVSGTGTSGPATASQLGDLVPAVSSSSVAFGSLCSSSTPCLFYLNGTRYPYTNSSTLGVSGSASDTVFVYLDNSGNRTAGYSSANTYTGMNMVTTSGINAFPAATYPLYQCTVTSGSFTGCADYRPILSETTFTAGSGTTVSTGASGTAINVAQVVDYISSPSYTVPGTVCGHYEIGTNASSGTWGLPTPGAGGMVPNGCTIAFRATNSSITLTPTGATINGGATYVVAAGQYCSVVSDGTNYQVGQCSGTYTAPVRGIGYVFDGGGNPLTVGKTGYMTVPYSCLINSWNVTVDTGTASVDVWKVATGTSLPTVANSITGSVIPSISSGSAIHSSTLTGWTTAVSPNDIFGFNLKAVSGSTLISLVLACQ